MTLKWVSEIKHEGSNHEGNRKSWYNQFKLNWNARNATYLIFNGVFNGEGFKTEKIGLITK